MLSASDLIIKCCETHRRSRAALFDVIDRLQCEWPAHTPLSPTPLRLATIASVSPQQQDLALRSYYKPTNGPCASHISFHQDLTANARYAQPHHA